MKLRLMAFSYLSWVINSFKCTESANSFKLRLLVIYINLLLLTANSICCHASPLPSFFGLLCVLVDMFVFYII